MRVIDFMPPRGEAPDVVRIVEGISGRVEMETTLRVRFDYGSIVPVGPPDRRRHADDRRARLGVSAHADHDQRQGHGTIAQFTRPGRRPDRRSSSPGRPVAPAAAEAGRRRASPARHPDGSGPTGSRSCHVRRRVAGRRHPVAADLEGADLRTRPVGSSRPPPRRCRRRSAASATGTTATAGYATPP